VALYGCLIAIEGGHQAAFMAPTEVLAEQHHLTVKELLDRAFGRWGPAAAIPSGAIMILTASLMPRDLEWIVDVLTWAPFMMLMTLGAIAAIPPRLYEAAAVDRAGAWFVLGNVTMPLVAPLLLGGIVVRVIDAMNANRSREFVLIAYTLLLAAIGIGELVARYRAGAQRGSSR